MERSSDWIYYFLLKQYDKTGGQEAVTELI
jgi:hypothetical protein